MEEQFLWALFESAAKSGNWEDLIRPFPASYLDTTGQKDPKLLLNEIENRQNDLKNWLTTTFPKLQQCLTNGYIQNYFSRKKDYRPNLVLSIHCQDAKEMRFHKHLGTTGKSTYALHGSKPENFFSILRHGLVNNLNKRDLYGSGTYLSTEITVALQFAVPQKVNFQVKYFG